MAVQITGKNIDIGESLRAHLLERAEQISEKYTGNEPGGNITVSKQHGQFITNCSLQLQSGLVVQASGTADDAYPSADLAFERLEKRIRRYSRRLKDHHTRRKDKGPPVTHAIDYVIEPHDDGADSKIDVDSPLIIAEKATHIQEIAVSDAVMELDLSEKSLLVFRNVNNGSINVVYRREDGNIGWIDPTEPA